VHHLSASKAAIALFMISIEHGRHAADEAKNVVRNVSVSAVTSDVELAVQSLREANDAAITAAGTNLLPQEHLNNARGEVAIAASSKCRKLPCFAVAGRS
jgi:hypothetical protein